MPAPAYHYGRNDMTLTFAYPYGDWKDFLECNEEVYLFADPQRSIVFGNRTDRPFYFVVRMNNVARLEGFEHQFVATLHMVSPRSVPLKRRERIAEEEDWPRGRFQDQSILLVSEGYSVGIKSEEGNDPEQLLANLTKEAEIAGIMPGFYLDRPVNRLGLTGWQAITGFTSEPGTFLETQTIKERQVT